MDSCNKNPWLETDNVKIWLKTGHHIQLDAFHPRGNILLITGSDFSVSLPHLIYVSVPVFPMFDVWNM